MPGTTRDFLIEPDELDEAREAVADCEELRVLLASAVRSFSGRIVVPLTRAQIESLSDALDARLILVGFDENYEVTKAGSILESLIERLGPLESESP